VLRCDECGTVAEDEAKGWQAMLIDDGYEECPFVVVFCRDCSSREFPDEDDVSRAEA